MATQEAAAHKVGAHAAQEPTSKHSWDRLIGSRYCPVELANCIQAYKVSAALGDLHAPSGTIFELRELPLESLSDYALRLLVGLRLDPSVWFCAIVLVSRCAVRVNSRSAHLLLLTALMVADKMQTDYCYGNDHYAAVGQVPVKDINRMERHMLRRLDFRVCVAAADMDLLLGELRQLNTEEKMRQFISVHEKKHARYLQRQQQQLHEQRVRQPAPQDTPTATPPLESDCDMRGLSEVPTNLSSPAPAPEFANLSVAHTYPPSFASYRSPQPPATARPAGLRPGRPASATVSDVAVGPPGGRYGLAGARSRTRGIGAPAPILRPLNSSAGERLAPGPPSFCTEG
eukprot:TRINITY_DN2714_c0_g1_i1.p1 TRINITY_DN2714_c0_g1~~TRINITY_DN2714_c0_g1_i1.p1  ORF type:complete len:376 (+),score=109.68 TRINITY_DN2714_c0_g1_i1:98-1129(+)